MRQIPAAGSCSTVLEGMRAGFVVVQNVKGRAKAYQVRQLLDVIERREESR